MFILIYTNLRDAVSRLGIQIHSVISHMQSVDEIAM